MTRPEKYLGVAPGESPSEAPKSDSVEGSSLTRRHFLAGTAGTLVAPLLVGGAAGAQTEAQQGAAAAPTSPAAPSAAKVTGEKFIAIQAGAISFADEGVDKALDNFQQRAGVNAVMLATFSYANAIAGRAGRGQPLPDHGAQQYDTDRQGGDYAAVHSQYYRDSVFGDIRAPETANFDVLAEVVPKAKARGMKSYAWYDDQVSPARVPGFELNAAEIDVYGRPSRFPCFANPHVQKFYASLAEDWVNSYELDGVMFGCERQGPLNNTIMAYGVGGAGHNAPTCFCAYCVEKARGWGLDPVRARAGFVALDEWVRSVRANGRPTDGYFVTFWRLLLEYPELLAWEKLWTDNLWSYYRLVYGELKAIRPGLRVGLHIWHNNSFSPFYRAEVDYSKYAECADFLKIVAYNNSGGPRMAAYVRNLHSTVLGDITPEQSLEMHYEMLGYTGEADYDHLTQAGFTAQYVAEEARRALAGVAGRLPIYMGVDVDVPTGPGEKRTQPEDVRLSVHAALEAGTQGVVLSRKYSEMMLANLSAAGQALKEMGVWKG
jgi:hypothetical protein